MHWSISFYSYMFDWASFIVDSLQYCQAASLISFLFKLWALNQNPISFYQLGRGPEKKSGRCKYLFCKRLIDMISPCSSEAGFFPVKTRPWKKIWIKFCQQRRAPGEWWHWHHVDAWQQALCDVVHLTNIFAQNIVYKYAKYTKYQPHTGNLFEISVW